jgi:hypothetical protein
VDASADAYYELAIERGRTQTSDRYRNRNIAELAFKHAVRSGASRVTLWFRDRDKEPAIVAHHEG